MLQILLVFHIILAITLIGIILLQKSSSDGLKGIGGGGNDAIISSSSSANFMTKLTTILAIIFMVNSLILGNLSNVNSDKTIIDELESKTQKEEKQDLPMAN